MLEADRGEERPDPPSFPAPRARQKRSPYRERLARLEDAAPPLPDGRGLVVARPEPPVSVAICARSTAPAHIVSPAWLARLSRARGAALPSHPGTVRLAWRFLSDEPLRLALLVAVVLGVVLAAFLRDTLDPRCSAYTMACWVD